MYSSRCYAIKRSTFLVPSAVLVAALVTSCDSSSNGVLVSERPADIIVPETDVLRNIASAQTGNNNLLVNPSFEEPLGDIPGWSACRDNNNLLQYLGQVIVAEKECIQQGVNVESGREVELSCEVGASSGDNYPWAGLGISFYDDSWRFVSEPDAAFVDSTDFSTNFYTVKGVVPAGVSNAGVWFYTESGGYIDKCTFRYTNTDLDEGTQDYDRTFTLERSRISSRLDGIPVDVLEYQTAYISRDKVLIDGDESGDQSRNAEFRIAHDGEYLYLLTGIGKPQWQGGAPVISDEALFMDSFPVNGALWDDDSFEIYLNPGNEDTQGYDENDFVRIYGFKNDPDFYQPDVVTGDNSKLPLTHEAACVRDEFSGTYCEVRYRLDELGLAGQDGAEVGFDIHWNFDDDGGQRDAKYSWCSDGARPAWRDMSTVKCSFILNY